MKRFHFTLKTLLPLTLLMLACLHMTAQSLSEVLQKQVWPSASPFTAADWENLTPSAGTDTVFAASDPIVEIVSTDAQGRPTMVIQLIREAGQWIPQTRMTASFDALGNLVALQSWTFNAGKWDNASTAVRRLDPQGNEASFELHVWEDGGWNLQYVQHPKPAEESLTARLAP
jgi:hypothetical protein